MLSPTNQHKRDVCAGTLYRAGAVFIILGILSVVFQIVALANTKDQGHLARVGSGIWCGIFFIFTGSCSIAAGYKLTSCTIILAVTVSVSSLMFAIAQLTVEILISQLHELKNSDISLHVVLAAIAVLALITGIVELASFFKTTFCLTTTAVPYKNDPESTIFSQTEITRDVKEPSNGRPIAVLYNNTTSGANHQSTASSVKNENEGA